MIDSHCHLNFESLKNDLVNILSRCKKNGVTKLLTINTNPNKFNEHINLIKNYKNIFISYGIHPQEITNKTNFSLDDLLVQMKNPQLIALGETGLDFYHSYEFKNKQIEIFESHIDASKKLNLPLIIHQRDSEKEIVEILKKYKNDNLDLVFHCFTGSESLLNFCRDNNYYISLSGIVTFKNADLLRNIIKVASLSNLLVETDSPYLTPVPMRGKENEPSFVRYTAEYLADFYNISHEEFFNLTDNNFYKLFSKAKKDN